DARPQGRSDRGRDPRRDASGRQRVRPVSRLAGGRRPRPRPDADGANRCVLPRAGTRRRGGRLSRQALRPVRAARQAAGAPEARQRPAASAGAVGRRSEHRLRPPPGLARRGGDSLDAARDRCPRAPRLGPRSRRVARGSPGRNLGRVDAGGGGQPGGDHRPPAAQTREGRQGILDPHGARLRLRPRRSSWRTDDVKAHSLTTRVLRGTVFVTLVTALAGAATAALLARGLWQAHEHRTLLDLAAGLAQAVEREGAEEGTTPESAAVEALRESVTSGHRAEVWRGQILIAASLAGPSIGAPGAAPSAAQGAWLIVTRPLRGGLLLVVASPREKGEEAFRVFGWSLLLSAPVCVVVAVLI